MPVVISGGGAVATVADTPQIDLGLTNAQLTADVVAGSIGSTQLSSAVNSALTLAGTAVQPAALTSYLPLSGGALTGAVTSTSTLTTRQSANTVQFLVSSGTAQTINWNSGGNINLDLSSATGNVTLTLQNPVSGAVYCMRVQQGGTVRNLIFPANTVQPGGGGTTYTGIAGVDFLTVYYNGSSYVVQSALNSGFTLSAASIAAAYLALAGGTMTGNLNLPSLNGGSLAGTRNVIINGGFDIWQRGTSFSGVDFSTGIYFADRFRTSSGGAGNQARYTVSQSTDTPSSIFNYSLRIDVTTAEAAVAAGELNSILQPVEGFNARHLIGQTFTLSFWVKSPKTGIHCVAFLNGGSNRSYVEEYTITAANTWEYKSITVAGGLITAGTWDWTTGLGLSVQWTLLAGTDFHTTKGAWQTGNFRATANQQNLADNTANDFFLAGVQLEPGSVATPFERRSYGQELALCQRYYDIVPVFARGQGSSIFIETPGYFTVEMRTAPTLAATGSIISSNVISEEVGSITSKAFRYSLITGGAEDTYVIGRLYIASAEL